MKILAIETSCDDTCIAIIETPDKKSGDFRILANIISSQVEIHKKYGGVYPSLAKREHQKNLPLVLKKTLNKAKNPKIDLIAVTIGPGLEPCLWVGVNFAKDLAKKLKVPVIPVNHIESHILVNFLNKGAEISKSKFQKLFPVIALVVSGGHTQLILMKNFRKYKILGETRDDAAGECLDKTARILGLGYPGGPIVAKMATKIKNQKSKIKIVLPRPMINSKDYDFSFSGLKTAVLYQYQKSKKNKFLISESKNQNYKREMCQEIQQAVIDVLIKKTIKSAKDYKARTIILGGGVAANEELRRQFMSNVKSQMLNFNLLLPPKNLCTDNALMTAIAGYFRYKNGEIDDWEKIKAEANLRIL